ncbi:MAG TPA: hypothetical protein VFU47_14615, partial [Armatimonadota bacterium]|nr:hypothetical protein [Armatimonadota bacterium]
FGINGDVYISDGYGNSRVVHLAHDGRYLGEWGTHGSAPGQFRLPHAICTDPDGLIYVADRSNKRIQVFAPDGRFVRLWRVPVYPFGLAITPDRRIFVCNEQPDSVTIYDPEGNVLGGWANPAPTGRRRQRNTRLPGQLAEPHMIAVDSQGAVYTAELRGHRVQKWAPQ